MGENEAFNAKCDDAPWHCDSAPGASQPGQSRRGVETHALGLLDTV